jgi:hypothetical protein
MSELKLIKRANFGMVVVVNFDDFVLAALMDGGRQAGRERKFWGVKETGEGDCCSAGLL